MKRFLVVLAIFCVPALAQTSISFNWNPSSNPTFAVGCPTSPNMCLSNYTMTGAGVTTTIPVTVKLPYVLSPAPAPGTYPYTLTLNGFAQNQKPLSSTPVTTSVTVPATNTGATVIGAAFSVPATTIAKDSEQTLTYTLNGIPAPGTPAVVFVNPSINIPDELVYGWRVTAANTVVVKITNARGVAVPIPAYTLYISAVH
jgi:hypothetical protein